MCHFLFLSGKTKKPEPYLKLKLSLLPYSFLLRVVSDRYSLGGVTGEGWKQKFAGYLS
jgi:hypothetical protein